MRLLLSVFASAFLLGSAQEPRTFTGVVTDSECATADHTGMHMGTTDAECVRACVDAHGATFMLFDGKTAYGLSDQKTPAEFAGRRVSVTGILESNNRTIRVSRMEELR
jgi:hypothetical protein